MKRVLIMLWVLWKLLANTPLAAQAPDSVDSAGGIQLTAFLDHVEVALNREAVLTLRLEWVGDLDRYEVYTPENPFVQNLTIIGNASANRVSQHDGKTHSLQEYTFRLKPTSLGMGYVEGMIIKYRDLLLDRDFRLTTNRLEIKITDPLPIRDPTMAAVFISRSGLAPGGRVVLASPASAAPEPFGCRTCSCCTVGAAGTRLS
jgi:hypothetical protein